jgi:hypothetical protein
MTSAASFGDAAGDSSLESCAAIPRVASSSKPNRIIHTLTVSHFGRITTAALS